MWKNSETVDATTSASVLPPGNAAKMAGWIQEEVGGDLFSIVVTEPYSSDYDECLDRAADEKAAMIFLEENELTEDMKEKLIEKVIVYPRNRIEIVWKFGEHLDN